jgi:predicted short-subunit dehydrogenase-like oxidoreductase (DUF2520 family)
VALIGAGRAATTIGILLEQAGHRVVTASGRDASRERVEHYLPGAVFMPAPEAAKHADLVILGVVDDVIEGTCRLLATEGGLHGGQWVLHLSGSMPLETLTPAEAEGAGILSLHPLQSFPDVEEGLERLPGSGIAVTARDEESFELGEALVHDLGGHPFRVPDEVKPLYHAAAVFSANYLVAVEALAERLMGVAGVSGALEVLEPLARTAFDRTFALGPTAALTGPAVRGDVGTIRRNLEALQRSAPEAVGPYVALARIAADLAEAGGRLSGDARRDVDRELDQWT